MCGKPLWEKLFFSGPARRDGRWGAWDDWSPCSVSCLKRAGDADAAYQVIQKLFPTKTTIKLTFKRSATEAVTILPLPAGGYPAGGKQVGTKM